MKWLGNCFSSTPSVLWRPDLLLPHNPFFWLFLTLFFRDFVCLTIWWIIAFIHYQIQRLLGSCLPQMTKKVFCKTEEGLMWQSHRVWSLAGTEHKGCLLFYKRFWLMHMHTSATDMILFLLFLGNSFHFTAMQAATKLCSHNNPAASHYDSNQKNLRPQNFKSPCQIFPRPSWVSTAAS